MRLTMIAIGSTGDVRPYILLGRELKSRGHDVKITAFAPFRESVEKEGLKFHPISGDVTRMMANVMKPGVTGFTYLQHFESAMKDVAPLLLGDLQHACQDAEGIICTFFGSTAYSIAEKNHIPCIQTHFFPMDYNASAPIAAAPGQRLGKTWNKTTYKVGYLLISTLEKRYLTTWRKEQGMRVRKIRPRPDYTINGHTIPVLYAMSPMLFPRPANWNEHIHMTGFWTSQQKEEFTPNQELIDFLAKGSEPIYIGFGSMVSGDMGETLQMVLDAVEQSGVRAIMAKGWGGSDAKVKVPKSVYLADYIPHSWLFDHVCAVVHHGGAGTTAAGLRAGKPTLVIPFGGDQPFWGTRVRNLGCGPKPIKRDNLSVEKLAKAITDLTTTAAYKVAAEELGARLQQENGVVTAADMIENEIANWMNIPDV